MTFKNLFSLIIIAFVFIVILMLFFVAIPDANKEILNTAVSITIGAMLTKVVSYNLPSTEDSSLKNETIKNLSENQKPQ